MTTARNKKGCDKCAKIFSNKSNLNRHVKNSHKDYGNELKTTVNLPRDYGEKSKDYGRTTVKSPRTTVKKTEDYGGDLKDYGKDYGETTVGKEDEIKTLMTRLRLFYKKN